MDKEILIGRQIDDRYYIYEYYMISLICGILKTTTPKSDKYKEEIGSCQRQGLREMDDWSFSLFVGLFN